MLNRLVPILLTASIATMSHANDIQSRGLAAHAQAPAFALGVAQASGTTIETHTLGSIRKGSDQPVDPNAQWHIGSITKSFTATLIMQLVEQDKLALDTPIATYLPNDPLHAQWQAITLRQLLSHTAGLRANAGMLAFRKRGSDNIHALRRDVLSAYWDDALKGTPGTYTYSNLGYVLAGFIAEEVTGETWENLIRTQIATPLNLTSLGFGAPLQDGSPWGHRNYVMIKRPVSPDSTGADNPPWLGPAGTLHLSLADLTRWGQAHLAACRGEIPDFLSQTSCETMQTEVKDGYGLGWVLGEETVWHNGSNTMWYAILGLRPAEDRVIVAATNVFDMAGLDAVFKDLRDTP